MPKMIKVTYSRPSEDVEWAHPLDTYSKWNELPEDVKASYLNFKNKVWYQTAADDAVYKIHTVVNDPDNLTMTRYMWFPDYPETTPESVMAYCMRKMAEADQAYGDVTINSTNPLTGEPITVTYNKGQSYTKQYRFKHSINHTGFEEVDYEFPSE